MKAPKFRVVIVGGGIGGIGFAVSLQETDIEYVLIEKGKELDPQVGASIGIMPNGARILDQLGCSDELASLTVGMESTATHKADGTLIGGVSDTLMLMQQRTGYSVIFLDRQLLLRTLSHRIKEWHRIRLQTAAKSIEQYGDKAVVHCEDGTVIEGDIVVGADGVHSIVRQEMWRHADEAGNGKQFEEDKNAMSAEYKCLFGISESHPGMQPGQTDRTYAHNVSTLCYVGKGGRVFWFVFIKMDKVYYPPNIPKFSSDDAAAVINQVGLLALREGGQVTIADVYNSNICCNLVAIEEAAFQHWSYGRLVCLGDAIHKMTPNLGAGASSALESAAILSNVLVQAVSKSTHPTLSQIRTSLEFYQKERSLRVGRTMNMTNQLTRVQALQTRMHYIFTHYIAPRADEFYAEAFSNFVIGAPVVEHLPIPQRSLQGTMPFNPKHGWGYEESKKQRLARTWPLLVMFGLTMLSTSRLLAYASHFVPVQKYLISTNQDPTQRSFILCIASYATYGLWLLEAARLNNKSSLAQFPLLFGLPWLYYGREGVVALYFFLQYTYTPIEKFRAGDNRLTDLSYTYTVAPSILLFGSIPAFLSYTLSQSDMEVDHKMVFQGLDILQQLLPLWISIIQMTFATVCRASTIKTDRLWAVRRDVFPIRITTCVLTATTIGSWSLNLFKSKDLIEQIINRSTPDQIHQIVQILLANRPTIMLTLTISIWLILTASDLRKAGMLQTSHTSTITFAVLAWICGGPGTLMVTGWQWREEILIYRRHREAVTETKAVNKPAAAKVAD